jgi:hypothetical protein
MSTFMIRMRSNEDDEYQPVGLVGCGRPLKGARRIHINHTQPFIEASRQSSVITVQTRLWTQYESATDWLRRSYLQAHLDKTISICRPCHSAVHNFIDNKTMGAEYSTLQALLSHEKVKGFVNWAAKQRCTGSKATRKD